MNVVTLYWEVLNDQINLNNEVYTVISCNNLCALSVDLGQNAPACILHNEVYTAFCYLGQQSCTNLLSYMRPEAVFTTGLRCFVTGR